MKIAITGKGGVGKTTIAALLGYFLSVDRKVFMVDADPDGGLGLALGFSKDEVLNLKPIVEIKEVISERVGPVGGVLFKMNPDVSDLIEEMSICRENLRLFVLGTTIRGEVDRCFCPENAFLKAFLNHILFLRSEPVIIDMPAGIEVLSRGTARGVDLLLIVIEPTFKSIDTACKIHEFAEMLNIRNLWVVCNKVKDKGDIKFVKENMWQEGDIVASVSFDEKLTGKENKPVYEQVDKRVIDEINNIKEKILRL